MSQSTPLSNISSTVQNLRRVSTRRRGSISATDPWGTIPETDRGVASVLHIVKAPTTQLHSEQDEKARRRRSLHNHKPSGGANQGRNTSPGASTGRISFAASGFGFTPLSGAQKDENNQVSLQRRSSIASHTASHTTLTPQQVCEIAQLCAHPTISRPSTPGNGNAPALSPVKFTPLPDTCLLPFWDRPAEVQELLTASPTRKLFLLLAQIFPAGRPPGEEDDPVSWNYPQLERWLTKTTREEADDISWIQKAKTCITARSEVVWERVKAAFGVPPDIDGGDHHQDIEGPDTMDGEDTSAVDDEYDDAIWVEEIVASSQAIRSPLISPTSSYFGRESPSLTRQGASRMEDISEDVSDEDGVPKRPVSPLVGLRIVNQPSPPPSRRYSSPTPSIHSASSSQTHLPYHVLSERGPGDPLFPSSFARVALGPTLKANNPALRSHISPPQSAFPLPAALLRNNRRWAESWDARRHDSALSTTSGGSIPGRA